MVGAPWREICKAPMTAAGIDPEAVEAEVQRRRGSDGNAALVKKIDSGHHMQCISKANV